MNTKNIHELTSHLCQALDQNYDVVNMGAVMLVISTLEGTTITKEQLETTRLAKFINHLRRRTKDDHLARRAKSLLKKWREMVGIQQQPQVIDTTPINLSAALPSGSGYSTSLSQQQRFRSQSISPSASSIHFEQHHSNSNSSQTIPASTILSEHIQHATSVSTHSLTPIAESANPVTHYNKKRFGTCQNQNETHIISKQPTSFENVLIGFGVTDNNLSITSDSSRFCSKLSQSAQQHVIPSDNTGAFIIDQSSNSNSQMSLILPSSNRPPVLAPIVIDIQDSNSGSDLSASVLNATLNSKMPLCDPGRAQNVSLASSLSIPGLQSQFPSKSKKIKKEKKRKDKSQYSVHETEVTSNAKDTTVLVDETSSNQNCRLLSEENSDKYSPFVNDEKSRLAYPEILSLLDNSSMSSMFPPESSPNPVDEQSKVNLSANDSLRTTFNLSLSDLSFAGKFKQGAALFPTSNELTGYKSHRPASIQTGPTHSKFTPFRGARSNSNDSNSQVSQPDLIEVISSDKMQGFQTQAKQGTLNLQYKTASTSSMSQQPVAATVTTAQQTKSIIQIETSGPGISRVCVAPEQKIPRKRGRKKGSKGVDSIIAKETSLSSQILMTTLGTGGKKVKTTKELYVEMQNRKLGITSTLSSPTLIGLQAQQQLQVSRPTSSCSEPSLQSPHIFDLCSPNASMSTVAARSTQENCLINPNAGDGESTSETGTSDPSRDSSRIFKQPKRSLSIDSNSNSPQFPSMKASYNSIPSIDHQIADIEKQLHEVMSNLPIVPDIAGIELKCSTEKVPCTCKVIELFPPSNDVEVSVQEEQSEMQTEVTDGKNYMQNVSTDQIAEKFDKLQTATENINVPKETGSNQVSTSPSLPPPDRPNLKKSIFDFDFEDDEDPLHTLKAEAAATKQREKEPSNSIEVIDVLEINALNVHQIEQQQHQPLEFKISIAPVLTQFMKETPMTKFPTYEVEEDAQCIAKQRFHLQTQKITKFHIDALHNCFIPNVNGNWDDTNNRLAQSNVLGVFTGAGDVENEYAVTDGYSVVPKYGSLVMERICKDLSHIQFSENFKPTEDASTGAKHLYILPFLGVARSVLTKVVKRKRHSHKICHKTEVTAFSACVYDKKARAASKIKANREFEHYKTDKGNFEFGLQIRDNQISTVQQGSMFHLGKTLDIEADSVVNKNINSATLKDITIDVIDHGSRIFLTQPNELSGEAGQNLLAIADHLDYGSKLTSLSQNNTITDSNNAGFQNNVEDLHRSSNPETDEKKSGYGCKSISSLFPVKLLSEFNEKNTTQVEKLDENASSRQSSSCSSSSLRQAQNSINLKLKRQLHEQKLLDISGEGNHLRQKNSLWFPLNKLNEENKQPKVKRIKIAVNRNIATEMQILAGSSNISMVENNNEKCIDNDKFHEENEHTSKGFVGHENVESVNSVGSRISICNKLNERSTDDVRINCRENCNDNQEVDYGENDVNADVVFDEYEDSEDYSSDYHEVVTRNISVPSTGSNHIVLTIKKTPSKTKSPSKSFSAMSPVIASNITSSSQAAGIATVISKTSCAPNLNYANKDMLVVSKTEAGETKANTTTAESLEEIKEVKRNHSQSDIWDNHANISSTSFLQNVETISRIQSLPSGQHENFISTSYRHLKLPKYKKYLKPNKRHRGKNIENGNGKFSHVKLHHELFFPHELVISDCYGSKRNILNFSSCSSSCGEHSEYEENEEYVGMNHISEEDFNDRTFSEAVVNSETDNINICGIQQHWDSDLSTSPCSTYSTCSTCDSKSNNYVQTESYNYKGCFDRIVQSSDYSLDTNEEISHTLADDNIAKSINEELPLENNGLLHSFNNIYTKVDKLEAKTTDTTIQNDNIVAFMAGSHMICDNKTVDPATVDAEKQQEQMRRNKNCDDYNNIYNNNKNSNNINLIRYYINEPSLITQVNRNEQSDIHNEDDQHEKESHLDVVNVFNANTDADFFDTSLNIDNYDKNTNTSNVDRTLFMEHSAKADQITNSSYTNRSEKLTQSSFFKSHCVHMLSHKENRTGLRAVDVDVNDDDGNNCARIQQFKEWHQVLQLRSYNEELLTVLPYVVLD
ncbi:unnamed protein product [Ceratitis capitata]|uniref:Mediator of RNA polymerase II transcription subunit 26 n=1 Tax=Ceratitis capitata TaxID=7213 RepID=A0A811UVV2_CERCA|nr:unnamed protein product [Ceratitis capitata]